MFIKNKYYKWYFSIIERALKREKPDVYCEKHHIIPKSCGGGDDQLVLLTSKEHFICHILLTKCTEGLSYFKMVHAMQLMMAPPSKNHTDRYCKISSKMFAKLRKEIVEATKQINTGKKRTEEQKNKMSEIQQAIRKRDGKRKAKPFSEETKEKMRQAKLGKPRSEETKQKLREYNTGKKLSSEHVEKIKNANKGRKRTEEQCKNIADGIRKKLEKG